VNELLNHPRWVNVTIVTRRTLEEWEQLDDEKKKRLKIIIKKNFDDFEDFSKWDELEKDYSTLFCCLGSTGKYDKNIQYAAHYHYPLLAAKLAVHLKIPHYSLVSAIKADKGSMFYLQRIKGELEEELKLLGFSYLTISKPGPIYNGRQNNAVWSFVMKIIQFAPTIDCFDFVRALRMDAELKVEKPDSKAVAVYFVDDLKQIARNNVFPN